MLRHYERLKSKHRVLRLKIPYRIESLHRSFALLAIGAPHSRAIVGVKLAPRSSSASIGQNGLGEGDQGNGAQGQS